MPKIVAYWRDRDGDRWVEFEDGQVRILGLPPALAEMTFNRTKAEQLYGPFVRVPETGADRD